MLQQVIPFPIKFPFLLLPLICSWHLCFGGDWPQFLGKHRDGRGDDTALIDSFGEDGPKLVWKRAVGEGFAGPVVAAGKAYVFHRVGNEAQLQALDAATGNLEWTFAYGTDYRDNFGFDEGPRSAPTIVGNQIFLFGAEGKLHAVDASNGNKQWSVDLKKRYQSAQGFFGRGSSPLIVGDRVVVEAGGTIDGKSIAVMAFDRKSGALAWSSVNDEADYASPTLANFHGKPTIVCFLRSGLTLLDPAEGKILYTERFRSDIHASVNAASPVILSENRLFLSSCYDVGAAVWEINGARKAQRLWAETRVLDCHYATPIASDGFLYGYHGRQESGTELRCIRASDGSVQWKSDRLPAGSMILADGKLLVLTERGELVIAPATPKQFSPSGRGQVLGADTRAMPALANGFLFCRDKKQLVCIDLRKTKKE